MKLGVFFDPIGDLLRKPDNDVKIYLQVQYQMYPEHREEFFDKNFQEDFEVLMDWTILSGDTNSFKYYFDLPYGDYSFQYFYTVKNEEEKKPIPDKELENTEVKQTPEHIISVAKQKELDIEEEENIKKREKEQKEKHKREMDERRQEAKERQTQMETQMKNSQKLSIYWSEMNLDFHTSEVNANTSLSIFSLFYDEIKSYFEYYTKLQYQFYKKVENHFITLHSFMHFLKLYQIAVTRNEIGLFMQRLETLIIQPPENVLNVKNGLNFAQFLEAIMRIVYYKVEHSDNPDDEEEYRKQMTKIFQEGTMEIQKKSTEDPIIIGLHAEDSQILFYGKYKLLGAIYQQKAVNKTELGLGLTFEDFYSVLEDSGKSKKLII